MNAVLDIIIIGMIIFCVAMGYKNGFVKTVMNAVSFGIAFFISKTFSPALAEIICSNWIRPNFAAKAAEQIEKFMPSGGGLDKLLRDRPAAFVEMLKNYGIDAEKWLREAASKADGEVRKAADNIVESVASGISYFLAFVAILAVSLIALKIITALINKATKLPALNLINKVGGILVGALYGIALSYIFVLLAYYVLPYLAANTVISSAPAVVGDTIFFKWFFEHSPLDYIMNLY